jgi:CheY-like chemotaxis protein
MPLTSMSFDVKPVVLLLEDRDDDIFFFRRALSSLNFPGSLHVVKNVTQARLYMENEGEFCDREANPQPDLIVSDLKMTGETGIEFLAWLHQHDKYSRIPFVMLSGSALPEDAAALVKGGGQAFYTKSAEFAVMKEQVRKILEHAGRTDKSRIKSQPARAADEIGRSISDQRAAHL